MMSKKEPISLASSSSNLEALALFSGTGILWSYNIFVVMMENILDLSFQSVRSVNDNGLLTFNCALLVSATMLLAVQSIDIYLLTIIISGFLVLAGTVVCQVSLWSDQANPTLFYLALGIIGFATGASQVSHFAVVASKSLREYNLANSVSMGVGLSGLISWILGVVTQSLFMDPATNLIHRGALLSLLGLAAIATLIGNCLFSLVLWPMLKESSSDSLEFQQPIGTMPSSQDPLCSETILHLRQATGHDDADLENHDDPSQLLAHSSAGISLEPLGGWDTAALYILLMFTTMFVTLFCFPCIAPLRWNLKNSTIWYMGVFQVADVAGRQIAKVTTATISLTSLSAMVLARLGLIGWSVYEAQSGPNAALSRIACMVAIGASTSYLFTILMRQGTNELRPNIAMTASTLMLLALMVGVNVGLFACKYVIERMDLPTDS